MVVTDLFNRPGMQRLLNRRSNLTTTASQNGGRFDSSKSAILSMNCRNLGNSEWIQHGVTQTGARTSFAGCYEFEMGSRHHSICVYRPLKGSVNGLLKL